MSMSEKMRLLSRLVPWPALLMAAACGGGDGDRPTGPGGGGEAPDNYRLVALGFAGLPADLVTEDCIETRFYSGGLDVAGDGRWQIRLKVHDDNLGDWGYKDEGQIEVDGETVWFDSQITEMSFEGSIADGAIRIMYDWCENGVPDVQLVFAP